MSDLGRQNEVIFEVFSVVEFVNEDKKNIPVRSNPTIAQIKDLEE